MERKRAKVIMLPTDKASQVGVCKYGERKGLFYGSEPSIEENLQNQYLYIVDDSEIKEGDWCINHVVPTNTPTCVKDSEHLKRIKQALKNGSKGIQKIIGTTNPELKVLNKYSSEEGIMELLPQIPQSFIEEYCRKGGVDAVDVEYIVTVSKYELELKVNSNNEIIIHPIKDGWTREEVEEIIIKVYSDLEANRRFDKGVLDELIKENL